MKGTLVKVYNHDDETAVIVYRDENLQKKKIVKTNMMVDYYLLKQGNTPDIFVSQDKTVRFETQYNNIVNDIVKNLDVVDPIFKQKAAAYMRLIDINYRGDERLKKNILRLPGIYGADEPLENRAIEWFYNNFEEDMNYKPHEYTAYFDIESDLMFDGKKKRNGAIDLINTPDPINIISLLYQDQMYVFAYNYGTRNSSFKEFISKFPEMKEKIIQKVYERNNSTYIRKGKTVKGKEIKLEDIKLYLFSTENELIRGFFDKLHELDPDFLFAWNASFDVRTIFGRAEKTQKEILKIEGEEHSKYDVQRYTKAYIADSKYCTDEKGDQFLPNYYYYISSEGEYTDAKNRRDYCEICDGINWLDQLIMHSILNNSEANDSDALDSVANEMFDIGKIEFDMGETIFNLAWLNYLKFFIYNIQDVMLLKKIEQELHNATEVYELSALYKCPAKDAFSQTKSTKSFMSYEAKSIGFVLRDNPNALNSSYRDRTNAARREFDNSFGLDVRRQLIGEITGSDDMLFRVMLDKDNFGGIVADSALNTNKNGIELYSDIRSNKLFGATFDKDYSSLYPSTKHALSIDDDGAVARYVIYDKEILKKQREQGYDKAYTWKSSSSFKKSEVQPHWLLTDNGDIEDQNLMIRLCDYLASKTFSKIGEDFLSLPNTTDLVTELIKGGK